MTHDDAFLQAILESPDDDDSGGCFNESVHDLSLALQGRAICLQGVDYHFGAGESRSGDPGRDRAAIADPTRPSGGSGVRRMCWPSLTLRL